MQPIEVVNIQTNDEPIRNQALEEARRQFQICNACRYCESYCSVFPALHRQRELEDSELQQLANLCHNCRACHYACQYTAPHEFAINVPAALAEVRQQVWQDNASPRWLARLFHRSGAAIAAIASLAFGLLLWLAQWQSGGDGAGFYAVLPHNVMVAVFLPAFILPLIAVAVGLRRYWQGIGGKRITLAHLRAAMGSVATMKNLAAGHGDGCNFEDEDRFSNKRRLLHQATMYGFLLCFAATSAGTIMHYLLDLPAPYSLFSVPKLLGISGGILLCIGTLGLAYLKTKADPELSAQHVWGGEMGFILLLFAVSSTGLLLYAFANSSWLPELLTLHLGTVLAFFVLLPFSKMVHGFYRMAALIRDEQTKTDG
ncbi:tricarballylate utilization 4Fe-4S protein TcuB [Marinobacter alexandrii]|uniref:tricarballylate utilization 4Fe-4S protein TcuB n=1 Tax=Marinobacter alexandrii TaxID=2570351 RepID=UPI001FFFC690|nr:tricarballylate utilization 4Fe-4S protein TcuB [Marinobacter alexandrii]MCK2148765.1 tricarballylate utilization 4Fe-4S protein TcuB [Marinobacter alexandrii]